MGVLAVVLTHATALATDNIRHPGTGQLIHWANVGARYRLNADLPADWKDAIQEGARAWNHRSVISLARGDDTSSRDPSASTTHILWRGAIPSAWRDGCPVSVTLACTRFLHDNSGSRPHLTDADTVFNREHSMGASTLNCLANIGKDVQTVAVHEFGHWGVLWHNDDFFGSVMYGAYVDCRRTPKNHDEFSMNELYQRAGH